MSNEELAVMIQNGDTSATPCLWEQVRRLCWTMVRKYLPTAAANKAVDMDDLMQVAFLGLQRAVAAYTPEEGALSTILGYYVRAECQALLGLHGRERKEHYIPVSLDAPMPGEDGDGGTLGELVKDSRLPPVEDRLELADLQREVREVVEGLPDIQREVIWGSCLQGQRMEDVAGQIGIPLGKAARLKQKAMHTMYRNPRLRAYESDFYRHKGITSFNSSWSSVVEDIALQRLGVRMHSIFPDND